MPWDISLVATGRTFDGLFPSGDLHWVSATALEPLDFATLHGLTSRENLNGADVGVGAYNRQTGRISVVLSNAQSISVLPEKLSYDVEEFEAYWQHLDKNRFRK